MVSQLLTLLWNHKLEKKKKTCNINNNNKRIILTKASYCEQANDVWQVGPLFPMWCWSVGEEHWILLSNGLCSQMSPRCAFVCFVSFLHATISHGAIASNTNTENVQEGADPAGLQGYLILREYEGFRCYEQAKRRPDEDKVLCASARYSEQH